MKLPRALKDAVRQQQFDYGEFGARFIHFWQKPRFTPFRSPRLLKNRDRPTDFIFFLLLLFYFLRRRYGVGGLGTRCTRAFASNGPTYAYKNGEFYYYLQLRLHSNTLSSIFIVHYVYTILFYARRAHSYTLTHAYTIYSHTLAGVYSLCRAIFSTAHRTDSNGNRSVVTQVEFHTACPADTRIKLYTSMTLLNTCGILAAVVEKYCNH